MTVGNYDGVHRGHQSMIDVVRERAYTYRCPSVVVAFEPSSKEFLDPDNAPPRITRWREKFLALAALRVDYFLTLRFDDRVRQSSPQMFEHADDRWLERAPYRGRTRFPLRKRCQRGF